MASRIAVMNAGHIVQVGPPYEIYERPATRFVADFIGIANILEADGGWLALRPEKITLAADRPDAANTVVGKILDIAYEGDRSLYRIVTEGKGTMVVSTTNIDRMQPASFARGQEVWLGWSADAGHRVIE